jgi:hypothetical protein
MHVSYSVSLKLVPVQRELLWSQAQTYVSASVPTLFENPLSFFADRILHLYQYEF